MSRSDGFVERPPRVEPESFIEDRRFGRSHYLLVFLCGLAAAIDGFDAQLITYLAPSIAHDLHLAQATLGPVFSLGILGMVLGSLSGGMIADRIGRRPAVLMSLLWFAIFSVLTAFSNGALMLIALRFVSGLGYGALMPNATALVAEFVPQRYRARAVMIMYCGVPVGGAIGGPATALLLEHHSWHFLFVVGGLLGFVIAGLLGALLPESLRFLVAKGAARSRIEAAMRFVDRNYRLDPEAEIVATAVVSAGKTAVSELFREGRLPITLLVWAIFLFASLDLYFLVTWLPTILQDHGVAPNDSLLVTSMFQLGGLCFPPLLARMIDSRHAVTTIGAVLALGACTTFLIGHVGTSVALLGLLVFLTGGFVQGGQTALNAVTAGLYPTLVRSSGVGWALGVSRVSGIIGPMLGAIAVAFGLSFPMIFALFATPVIVAFLAALALARVTRERLARS
jgi:AAHS family 4-hydroxybenzoate transporter-like MFS transporter